MNKKDKERLEELKLKIWKYAVIMSLHNSEDIFVIPQSSIESNRGRIRKALRLLESEGYISYMYRGQAPVYGNQKRNSNSEEELYKIHKIEESKAYAEAYGFDHSLSQTHSELFSVTPTSQDDIESLVYLDIDFTVRSQHLFHIYWNKEYYVTHRSKKNFVSVYPKHLIEHRIKNILRSIVEQYLHENFHTKIEQLNNLPKGVIKFDNSMEFEIRNFAAHGHRFGREKYLGKNGFLEEYKHYRDYFQSLVNTLEQFNSSIEKQGGYEAIVEKYRKEIIETMLKNTPLNITKAIDSEDQTNNPYINRFIIANAEYFNYDSLYKEDQSILVIKDYSLYYNCNRDIEDTKFEPKEDEILYIKSMKEAPAA